MLPLLPDHRVRQRDYLLEIIRALTQQLDLETVLKRILEAATDILSSEAALLVLRDEQSGRFRVHIQHRVTPEFVRHFDSVLGDLIEDADTASLIIKELERRLDIIAQKFDLAGTIGLPLQLGEELLGVLLIFRAYSNPVTSNDRQILQTFTDQAAIAVNNARLYQRTFNERQRIDAILEGSADGIAIMDAAHNIERWNRALIRLTGFQPDEAIGENHDTLIRWARREPGLDLSQAEANGWGLSTTAPLYVEGDLLKRDGRSVAVGITYAPIFDQQGHLVNIVASMRDITKFREAEQLKSTFISVISHELKTPVSLIKGYAGTLRREDAKWDADTVRESLTVIEEEADRLTNLIENLLEASRLQAGALKLNLNEVAVDKLAAQLAKKFQTQSPTHSFMVEFPPAFPIVRGDEERLRQVLTNFLSNAIKYSPEGGQITISGVADTTKVTITVSDQGSGLPPDELARVFDRFYRADTPATKRAQGAGLGLYLAKAVVDAHNGEIWAESEPGKGAKF